MSRSLGGVALPTQIYWSNRRAYQGVAQAAAFTIAGGVRIWSQALTAGRSIDLSSVDREWLTRDEMLTLEALANQPGLIYPLVWDEYSAQVMFRHHDPPAFEADAVQQLNSEADDVFTVKLKLITV